MKDKDFQRDSIIFNVTEDILVLLERKNIDKKEFARILGKSKSFVTQVLSGKRNMTLKTLSDMCHALGVEPKITILADNT